MAVDGALAGTSYPPTEIYEVSRLKIREFAEAVGAHSPVHTDPEAARALGHADVIAPPTFPFLVTHRASDRLLKGPEWGLEAAHLIHLDQRITQNRPVRAGDRLAVTLHLDSVTRLGGKDVLRMRGEVRDADGGHVADAHMTVMAGMPEERKP
ncbi:MaoC family dehydratase N-terminal domain-containing protein [Streptomyces sp. NPDC003038]|uniref:FAS1-like dehydratase domain-containing protein n=1 Tax=unclassified Streptomyces TaxID=2593676 RepID=UPI0033A9CE6C